MSDRKARLAALAARAGRSKKPNEGAREAEDVVAVENDPKVSFRNYTPNDTSLNDNNNKDDEPPAKRQRQEENRKQEEATDKKTESSDLKKAESELPVNPLATNLQEEDVLATPTKINADLKRDIQDKLDKLERRTQRAIVALLKERLTQQAVQETTEEDLMNTVFPHPTLSEMMYEAVLDAYDRAIHV